MSAITGKRSYPAEFETDSPPMKSLRTIERENPGYTMQLLLQLPSPPSSSPSPLASSSADNTPPEEFGIASPLSPPVSLRSRISQSNKNEISLSQLPPPPSWLSLVSSISTLADITLGELCNLLERPAENSLTVDEFDLITRDFFEGAASEWIDTLGHLNEDLGNASYAFDFLLQSSGIDLSPTSSPASNQAEERFEQGVRLYREGNFSEASKNLLLATVEGHTPAIEFILNNKHTTKNFKPSVLRPLLREFVDTPRNVEMLNKMLPLFDKEDEFDDLMRSLIPKQVIAWTDDPVKKRDLLFDLGSKEYTGAIPGKRYSLEHIEASAKLGHPIALDWMIDTYSSKEAARYEWLRIAADSPDYSEGPHLPAYEMAKALGTGTYIEKNEPQSLKYYLIFAKSIEKSHGKRFYLKNHFPKALKKIESMSQDPLRKEWEESLAGLRAYVAHKSKIHKEKEFTFS